MGKEEGLTYSNIHDVRGKILEMQRKEHEKNMKTGKGEVDGKEVKWDYTEGKMK